MDTERLSQTHSQGCLTSQPRSALMGLPWVPYSTLPPPLTFLFLFLFPIFTSTFFLLLISTSSCPLCIIKFLELYINTTN